MEHVSKLKSLEDVLSYQNSDLIDSFTDSFDLSYSASEEIFQEMFKWLWLCAKAKEDNFGNLYIGREMRIIDQAWHTFILFSVQYENFCMDYLGRFIYHKPTLKSEKEQHLQKAGDPSFINELKEKQESFYAYILEHLGKETLYKWFIDFNKKYPSEYINSIAKPIYKY